MNNASEIQQDEEISLLDLFTVLLRYRKLIIGITLVSVLLAVVGYFIYPAYQYKNALKNASAQGGAVISIRQNARGIISQNPEGFINRADVIIDSLKDAGVEYFEYARNQTVSLTDETQRSRALYLVNQIMIANKDLSGKPRKESARIFWVINNSKKEAVAAKDGFTVEVYFKDKDPDVVKNFLAALFVRSDSIASEIIRPNAESFVQNHEQLLELSKNSAFSAQTSAGDNDRYVFFKDFINGRQSVLTEIGEPVITEAEIFIDMFKSKYLTKGIIIVFAGFFMAVFLAFALNVIRNIKGDEESMKKIYDALGNSKDK